MIFPIILFFLSVIASLASLYVWGGETNLPLMVSLVSAVAALGLVVGAALRPKRKWIVLDGSNIMYWLNETPDIGTVTRVVRDLEGRGLVPVVWFDANAGYLVSDRYMGPHLFARELGLSARQVLVAPKGMPADPLILNAAARLNARVVSNDRYRDWAEDFPQISAPGFLVRGAVTGREVSLRLGE